MDTTCILNVDDSEAARYAKTRILTRAGFNVIEATNGTEALAMAKSAKPQLILLDVKLPDINGFEVCKRIKEDPQTKNILVLQTSASFVVASDKVRALEGGADNYLVEPIEPAELVANVKALLRLSHAESKMLESERRFRQIAENVSDVFWIFNCDDGSLLYVSPAYETVWERSAERLAADPNDWLAMVHVDDRIRVETAFARLAQSGLFEEEYRLVRPGGDIRWVRDRGFPVRSDEGGERSERRIARLSQDITERKLAEERLQQADRKKDEFLATLAHELRNPLGPIRNSVELMKCIAPNAPEAEQRARQIILRQTNHMVRLVDDLLDVSRITHGKVTLRQRAVELREFIRPAIEIAQGLIDSRRHQFTMTLPEREIWVLGDAVRLAQIIGNLLTNASKFTPMGGKISLNAQVDGGKLTLSVIDNGIGIDPARSQHIFDLFAQAGHAPDRAQDGLGIGLSLVRKLVELHGGSVQVESAGIGQGSRFDLILPVHAVANSPFGAAQSAEQAENARAVHRVLVVDDNRDSADTLAALIESDGHECVVANNGPEAIELAATFRPDTVILDIGLPGMSGYDVARALKQQATMEHAKLVALTGYGQPRDKERALEAGFDRHLVKPIDMNALAELGLASIEPPPEASRATQRVCG